MAIHKNYDVWLKVDGRLNLGTQKHLASKYGLDYPDRMPDIVVRADNLKEARKKAEKKMPKGTVIDEIKNAWWCSGKDFHKHNPFAKRR